MVTNTEDTLAEIAQILINAPEVSGIVGDQIYHWSPPAEAKLPALSWSVADIRTVQDADNQPTAETWKVILDAFCRGSPVELAKAATAAMISAGFVREYYSDVPAEKGVNQITMRFSKIYEVR